jgi:hypothetical protein
MSTRILGLLVGASEVVVVEVEARNGRYTVHSDETWALDEGDRAVAYAALHARLVEFMARRGVSQVVLKASAVGPSKASLSHLKGAEVRGVVQAAAASQGATVLARAQATLSRGPGKRKAEEYVNDEEFWKEQPIEGKLRKGSRIAMLLILGEQG